MILLVVPRIGAASSNDVRASFELTFTEVKKAEQSGGDVSALLPRLNLALQLINSGSEKDLQNAQIIIEEVNINAQNAQVSGIQTRGAQYTIIGSSLVILSASAVLIYIYGESLFWVVWAWTKRNWVVKNK